MRLEVSMRIKERQSDKKGKYEATARTVGDGEGFSESHQISWPIAPCCLNLSPTSISTKRGEPCHLHMRPRLKRVWGRKSKICPQSRPGRLPRGLLMKGKAFYANGIVSWEFSSPANQLCWDDLPYRLQVRSTRVFLNQIGFFFGFVAFDSLFILLSYVHLHREDSSLSRYLEYGTATRWGKSSSVRYRGDMQRDKTPL